MCNETHEKPIKDYRFLDYRLDQLELRISKGMEKLEREQDNNYKELIKVLQSVQESTNLQNEKIIEISQRQQHIEEKIQDINQVKEALAIHSEQITNLNNRVDIYKKVILGIIIAVAGAIILRLI